MRIIYFEDAFWAKSVKIDNLREDISELGEIRSYGKQSQLGNIFIGISGAKKFKASLTAAIRLSSLATWSKQVPDFSNSFTIKAASYPSGAPPIFKKLSVIL